MKKRPDIRMVGGRGGVWGDMKSSPRISKEIYTTQCGSVGVVPRGEHLSEGTKKNAANGQDAKDRKTKQKKPGYAAVMTGATNK